MTKFSDLKLDPKVLQAVVEAGYENPTPIQAGAIPPALEGRDVLGIAQTGTGKTASFTLPMITLLGRGRARARMPRSLVLCPTRELAAQVAENFETYAKHTRLTKALLIGGVSFGEQDKLIDRGVDVLIATPGRLLDHFERGKLLLTGVQIMVVDEADRMLDMGFIPDIERIFQLTPFTRQTLFFSATMAPEIERITNTFLNAPERIEVARQATTSETITQKLVELTPTRKDQSAKQKRELLRALIDAEGEALKNAMIFCNRKTDVDIVAKSLKAHGYDAAPIHGDLDQRVRTATLDGFRDGSLRFLVASDVAARGLDIPAVSHVFNFDLPSHAEDYVHRIGRTGRAGRQGTAISIATPSDEKYLAAIENLVKQTLPRASVPDGFHLSEAAQRPAPERAGSRGVPSRSRSRRGPRDETRDAAPAPEPAPSPAAPPARQPEPERVTERTAERPADRVSERQVERPAERQVEPRRQNGNGNGTRSGERDDRRDDRRDRYRDRDRGPVLQGMGEHVPDFMLTSFSAALATTDARMSARGTATEAATTEAKTDATPADVQDATDAGAGAGRGRSRSRSRRGARGKSDEIAAVDAAASETSTDITADTPEPAADVAVSTDHSESQPQDTAAEPASGDALPAAVTDTDTDTVADVVADTATQSPAPATDSAKAAEPGASEPEAEPKPAPKRTRTPRSTAAGTTAKAPAKAPAKTAAKTTAGTAGKVAAGAGTKTTTRTRKTTKVAAVEATDTATDTDAVPEKPAAPVRKSPTPRTRKTADKTQNATADAGAADPGTAPAASGTGKAPSSDERA